MSFPLWELAKDLAMARSGAGPDGEIPRESMRGRLAALLAIPGMVVCLVAGELADSWIVGVSSLVVLVAALALLVLGPSRIGALAKALRRRP